MSFLDNKPEARFNDSFNTRLHLNNFPTTTIWGAGEKDWSRIKLSVGGGLRVVCMMTERVVAFPELGERLHLRLLIQSHRQSITV